VPQSLLPWWLALAVAAPAGLLLSRNAGAQDCQPLREVRPLPEEPLPANGYIWDVCYYVVNGDRQGARSDEICAAPRLFDAQGAAVPLEIERRADAPPTRQVTRYRPLVPLQVGATYALEPGEYARPSGRRSVRVVAAVEVMPAPPELRSLDYQVRGESALARFRFADFDGLLVKDLGAQGQVSLAAVDLSRQAADAMPELELLKTPCRENFAAEPGASTMLRFGVLDLAGNFSGWGETAAVQFPESDVEFSAAGNTPGAEESSEEDGGCSLRAGAPASGTAERQRGRGASSELGLWAAALLVGLARVRRIRRAVRNR
jgi:hypothetical protein